MSSRKTRKKVSLEENNSPKEKMGREEQGEPKIGICEIVEILSKNAVTKC
jgi:hypothetical protein